MGNEDVFNSFLFICRSVKQILTGNIIHWLRLRVWLTNSFLDFFLGVFIRSRRISPLHVKIIPKLFPPVLTAFDTFSAAIPDGMLPPALYSPGYVYETHTRILESLNDLVDFNRILTLYSKV